MLASHELAAPNTGYIGIETVPILKLDSIAHKILLNYKKPFLKIDTQGYEWSVLDGVENSISKIHGVLLEMSLVPLYENQYLWEDLILRMNKSGFTLWGIQPGFNDPLSGRSYQVDGIFYRL
jgi:hypothetical protein